MTENIIYGIIKENHGNNCVVDIENDTITTLIRIPNKSRGSKKSKVKNNRKLNIGSWVKIEKLPYPIERSINYIIIEKLSEKNIKELNLRKKPEEIDSKDDEDYLDKVVIWGGEDSIKDDTGFKDYDYIDTI